MKENRIIKKVTYICPVKDAPDDYKYWINRSTEEEFLHLRS